MQIVFFFLIIISLPCPIPLARTFTTILNSMDEYRHPCLVFDLRGKVFSFHRLIRCDFFTNTLYHVEEVPFYFYLPECLYHEKKHCVIAITSAVSLWPRDCSPPGSSVRGTFQARTLERVAMTSSRGSSRLRDRTHTSCISCIGR